MQEAKLVMQVEGGNRTVYRQGWVLWGGEEEVEEEVWPEYGKGNDAS